MKQQHIFPNIRKGLNNFTGADACSFFFRLLLHVLKDVYVKRKPCIVINVLCLCASQFFLEPMFIVSIIQPILQWLYNIAIFLLLICFPRGFFLFSFCLTAPEVQLYSNCSVLSDMFSLGLVMAAIFNQGHALIQANNSASTYLKQLEAVRWIDMLVELLFSAHKLYICNFVSFFWMVLFYFAYVYYYEFNACNLCNLWKISSCLIPCKKCYPAYQCHCKKPFLVSPVKNLYHGQLLNSYNWSNTLGSY